jgi:hypothetical protein
METEILAGVINWPELCRSVIINLMLYNSGQIYNPSQNYKSCAKIYPWKHQNYINNLARIMM